MRLRVETGSDGLANLLPRTGPRRRTHRRSRRRESKRSQAYGDPLPNHAKIVARPAFVPQNLRGRRRLRWLLGRPTTEAGRAPGF